MGSVLIYMGLLGFGATTSPGVGILGRLIEMLPQPVTELSHAPAYGLLTWMLSGALQRYGWSQHYALFVAILTAFVFGIWMEIFQSFVPGRAMEGGDVLMNGIGIGTTALLILWREKSIDSRVKVVPARSYTHVN